MMIRLPTGEELREKRTELGLTQKEVATRAGISQPLVARIEKGGVDPRLSTLSRLVDVLNRAATDQLPKARDLIEGGLAYVPPGETVKRAIKTMRERGFSQLPVFDRGKPVGLVSTRTLVERVQQLDDPRGLGKVKVSEIMGPAPPAVDQDASFSTLENLLLVNDAVLVQNAGEFIGIVTKEDILRVV